MICRGNFLHNIEIYNLNSKMSLLLWKIIWKVRVEHNAVIAPHSEVKYSVTDKHLNINTHTLSQLHKITSTKANTWRRTPRQPDTQLQGFDWSRSVGSSLLCQLPIIQTLSCWAPFSSLALPNKLSLFYIYLLPAANCCWDSLTWQITKKNQHEANETGKRSSC